MARLGSESAWLIGGAAAGLALAFTGMIERSGEPGLPGNAAARVNTTLISNEDFREALTRFGMDSREPMSETDRRWVLERLIDEELLLQQALELGLVADDATLRNLVVSAMIDRVVAEADAEPVNDDELRSWFADNEGLFATQRRYRIAAWRGHPRDNDGADAAALDADPALTRLDVPDTLLPVTKLVDYVGPGLVQALSGAERGTTVTAMAYSDRPVTAYVIDAASAGVPDFATHRADIETAWRRERRDERLRNYLGTLRRHADVSISDEP